MHRGIFFISMIALVFAVIAPCFIIVCEASVKSANLKSTAYENNGNLPLVVEDTSGSFKTSSPVGTNELTKIDSKNDFIYLNTIDGLLYAVSKQDGKIKWTLEEEAVLKFPESYDHPYFLTDPRDGSLYVFTSRSDGQNGSGGLRKFPYTIAELVSASPSKSSDGYLYTGDKKDQWLAIDYRTGAKLDTLTAETLSSKISIADDNVIFVGRTQYTITMFDISTRRKIFNLTYYDYSTHAHASRPQPISRPMTANAKQDDPIKLGYPYYHFTSSSDGTIVTLDRKTGELLWTLKLRSPVIAMYRYENEQLFKIQFAIYAVEALTNLHLDNRKLLYAEQKYQDSQLDTHKGSDGRPLTSGSSSSGGSSSGKFVSTLYIGYHNNNLYALPSFVYSWHSLQPVPDPPPLIGDPGKELDHNSTITGPAESTEIVAVGHHPLPARFDPPPDFIQPNQQVLVIPFSDREPSRASNLAELFSGQPSSCPADSGKENKTRSGKRGIVIKFWRKFDELLQNRYFSIGFTVFLVSVLSLVYKQFKKIIKRRERLRRLAASGRSGESSSRSNGNVSSLDGTGDYDPEDDSSSDDSVYDDDNSGKLRTPSKSDRSSGNRSRNSSSKHSQSSHHKRGDNNTGPNGGDNSGSNNSAHIHPSQSAPSDLGGGLIQVGKITYDLHTRLGNGCSGTMVYKGTFESRPVAVKRLLPDCHLLAEREVSLLCDADEHPNVLRYYCTESDFQFRYIALELCQMTLAEYVHDAFNFKQPPTIKPRVLDMLEQATCGLNHLHSLSIVHRDIKPQNVLISFPDARGRVTVKISDFGLCKRLGIGNNSFSKQSGILGTDGWIAPEVLCDLIGAAKEQLDEIENPVQEVGAGGQNVVHFVTTDGQQDEQQQQQQQQADAQQAPPKRITKALDIFSLGCVYYFVLSGGVHPFGDRLMQTANIIKNKYSLERLSSASCEIYMQRVLIEKMISSEPKKRPTTKEILTSPVFWTKAKILQFLQDVSDRIEKLDPSDVILKELEVGASAIIRNNWKTHICPFLQDDLKRYRTYNGVCLRDLLRAIRNKKHHYYELPDQVKNSLGKLPDEFVDYFTSRFPKLINHVYDVMKRCSNEPMLDVYYQYTEN